MVQITTVPRERVVPNNKRGVTRRTGRVPSDVLTFIVRAETFGDRLRRLRIAHGLTQAQVAERAGCERKMLWWYERDASRPPVETLARFADALGTTMDYLWRGES